MLWWWDHLRLRRVEPAILSSMPAFAARLARVQAERTREPRVGAHRPAFDLASGLVRATELRAPWLHVRQWKRHSETDGKTLQTNKNGSMRLYEDIDTTGEMEDMSKTKRVRSKLHDKTKMIQRSFKCQS